MRGSIDFPGLARVNEVGHRKKFREPVFKNIVSTYLFSKIRGTQKYWGIHRQHFHFLKQNPHPSVEQSYKPLRSERDVLCRRTAVKFCSSVARWITWLTGHSRTRHPRKKNTILPLPWCIFIYSFLCMYRCRFSSSPTLVTFTAARITLTTRVDQLTYSVYLEQAIRQTQFHACWFSLWEFQEILFETSVFCAQYMFLRFSETTKVS